MASGDFRLSYTDCRALLRQRLAEDAPGRIQLLSGPRQVGKTTLLLELAKERANSAIYVAGDDPEAALPGDRKSTRLNSSHSQISYAVFCLKKKIMIKQ